MSSYFANVLYLLVWARNLAMLGVAVLLGALAETWY